MIRSFLVSSILVYLCRQTVDYLESYTEDKKEDIEKYIRALIPGEAFDDVSWEFVSAIMPQIFSVARILIGEWKDSSGEGKRKLLATGVVSVMQQQKQWVV